MTDPDVSKYLDVLRTRNLLNSELVRLKELLYAQHGDDGKERVVDLAIERIHALAGDVLA